ncbi:MAG: alpha-L-fucosidase, partial [Chloroflexi bacterium]|nr:alpha-L-fucosidase [Chloroflexota bacterium]
MTVFAAVGKRWFVLGLLLLGIASTVRAESAPGIPPETPEQCDARMKWWREARFGMFIHWGLYAIPGGRWKGQPVGGAGEWIMNTANIPVEEYEQLAKQFNPVKYDPAQWVKIAKDAGMRYIVITSKHHDG